MKPLAHAAIQRFQIEHHARTGEILDFAQATVRLAEERRVQQLCAREDMIARLEHARRCVGQRYTDGVPEEGFPEPRLLTMEERFTARMTQRALDAGRRIRIPTWLQP